MSDTENLVLTLLQRIQAEISQTGRTVEIIRDDLHNMKIRLTNVEENLVGMNRRLDNFDLRLDRIERRLDLVEV